MGRTEAGMALRHSQECRGYKATAATMDQKTQAREGEVHCLSPPAQGQWSGVAPVGPGDRVQSYRELFSGLEI